MLVRTHVRAEVVVAEEEKEEEGSASLCNPSQSLLSPLTGRAVVGEEESPSSVSARLISLHY